MVFPSWRALKTALIVFGAIGLPLLIFALLFALMPRMLTNPLGYQFLIFFITTPLGAVCGAIFGEVRS